MTLESNINTLKNNESDIIALYQFFYNDLIWLKVLKDRWITLNNKFFR